MLSVKQLILGAGAQSVCRWSAVNESPTCACMFWVKQKDRVRILWFWFACVSKLINGF